MANLKYLECEYYSIEEHTDGKKIHIHGYFYPSDGEGKDYRSVVYCWVFIPIELFPDNYEWMYDEKVGDCKQYIDDLTEFECEAEMMNWFEEPPIELPLSEITLETPCGNYVSYKA